MAKSSTSIKPGEVRNPGGRPKALINVRDLARQYTELAMTTLAEIAGNADAKDAARVTAAIGLLDRGWGKPVQPIDGDGNGAPVIQEIRRIILHQKATDAS